VTTPLDVARVPFAADLARHGERPAILAADRTLSYRELADRVDDVAGRLGTQRRLVLLAAANDVDSVVGYLAALSAGHPVLLVPGDKADALDALLAAYDPDVVLRSGDGTPVLEERRPGTRHELHPDLALLLSTSGSTGSPKLVRLSHENLAANAEAIAEYLGIGPDDRAATTLPMSYCYGLSVLNSHLLRGAGLVLTDLSVVDPCFWDLFRAHRATSLAAVPYTFDLLERIGFDQMALPHLRYVTQAGGRLAPEKVRHWAGAGERAGWDLVVMYGATEATARMAYLPPERAAERAGTIGVPIPGGRFRIDPVDGSADGELVYSGPNVMLGYAQHPGDLALGRTVEELRTGDLARRHDDGLYEVVGRRSRFVKIVGLRVDLGRVERILSELGVSAAVAGTDERLVVAAEGEQDTSLLAKLVAGSIGLPRPAVEVHAVEQLPRLSTGKVDYPAVLVLGAPPAAPSARQERRDEGPEDVRRILAEVLERPDVGDDDTFVSLEGDSLSYVAASVRLEQALGHLPPDWHLTPVRDLAPRPVPRGRGLVSFLETGIVLRAVAIVCIVATHVELFTFQTAHVLFAVAGYNFARFQLHGQRLPRLRRQLRSLGRIVVPSVAFIAVAHLLTDDYTLANVVLLNGIVGPQHLTTQWHFWFVEMLVYVLVAVTALMALPWADRAERAAPWLFPLALVGVGLLSRYDLVDPGLPKPAPVFWIFALGWAAACSRTVLQRSLVSLVVLLSVPGYFDSTVREATLVAGILLLLWVPTLPVPVGLRRVAARLAAASLYVYLTHWLVYPGLVPVSPVLAVAASLLAGVAYWALSTRLMGVAGRRAAARAVPGGRSGASRRAV
jgi:acyl-CoA synthetase (AMP-forming)/AMP-acid ligase II